MSGTVTFDDFLDGARRGGAVVALRSEAAAVELAGARRVDGADMTRLAGVYSEFARAWEFPDYFGANKDAFDDCMRDLTGSPLVTEISSAQRLLVDEPRQLRWFADALTFYADHYRQARPGATFAVVLTVPATVRASVRRRWRNVDVEPILLGE
ncbi:barstar family protein [Gordonia sp. CPCC 205333]|uniref:barstar family protein n=1 Tax=Gordonia sp. CPCC 205333 TaxID=3140790 RepID=UPI003AF39125